MKKAFHNMVRKLKLATSCKHIRKLRKGQTGRSESANLKCDVLTGQDLGTIHKEAEPLIPRSSADDSLSIGSDFYVGEKLHAIHPKSLADDEAQELMQQHLHTVTASDIALMPSFILTAPAIRVRRQSDSFVYTHQELSDVVMDYAKENRQLQSNSYHAIHALEERLELVAEQADQYWNECQTQQNHLQDMRRTAAIGRKRMKQRLCHLARVLALK